MKIKLRRILLMLSCFWWVWIPDAQSFNMNIKIYGEIYIPPCRINDNDTSHISFGRIALQKVNGQNYAESRTVKITCKYYVGMPYIRVNGVVLPGAGDNVLKTNGANPDSLGIALYQGEGVDNAYLLKIGSGEQGMYGFKIKKGLSALNSRDSEFTFTAVPYKYGQSDLKAGVFNASMTMSISYL
ncbi:TPA: fimbrial protein [Citrobacter freundii]